MHRRSVQVCSVHEHRADYEQDSCYNDATAKERGALIRRFFHKGRMDTRAKLLPPNLFCDKIFFRASSRCETVWNPRPSCEAKAALLASTPQSQNDMTRHKMKRALIAVLVFFVAGSAIASRVISRQFRSLGKRKASRMLLRIRSRSESVTGALWYGESHFRIVSL